MRIAQLVLLDSEQSSSRWRLSRRASGGHAGPGRPEADGRRPRIRVSVALRWQDRLLLCKHEKPGKEYWLLPGGGGVKSGESLVDALRRELLEEVGVDDNRVQGQLRSVDSIDPVKSFAARHVVHIIFAGDLTGRSLEAATSKDAAVRGHRLVTSEELDDSSCIRPSSASSPAGVLATRSSISALSGPLDGPPPGAQSSRSPASASALGRSAARTGTGGGEPRRTTTRSRRSTARSSWA